MADEAYIHDIATENAAQFKERIDRAIEAVNDKDKDERLRITALSEAISAVRAVGDPKTDIVELAGKFLAFLKGEGK